MNINGVELDPLIAAKDENKPLISKLLAVPKFKERYLGYVRDIATKWLDWNQLGPIATKYQALIAADVKADTRKLESFEEFEAGLQTLNEWLEQRFRTSAFSYPAKRYAHESRAY